MTTQKEALKLPQEQHFYYAADDTRPVRKPLPLYTAEQMREYAQAAIKEALAQQSNEQVEPVAKVDSRFDSQVVWYLDQLPKDGTKLYTHPPVPTAQPRDCTRSHPHEEMSKECELRTEIARLTSQQAHRSQAQLQLKMTALEKAWFHGYENDIESALRDLREEIINPTLVQPKEPELEPVATLHDDGYWTAKPTDAGRAFNSRMSYAGARLDVYTAPPQRKPLTDDQERETFEKWCFSVGLMAASYGILSESSHCGTAWKAWKARAAHSIKEGV